MNVGRVVGGVSVIVTAVALVGCGADNQAVSSQQAGAANPAPRTSCKPGGPCKVGDIGPGGGTVFSVDEKEPAGNRYREAAPATWNDADPNPKKIWCNNQGVAPRDVDWVRWTGKQNTDYMMAGCSKGAANSVRAYGTAGAPAGSWFLPSLLEMRDLRSSGVGEIDNNSGYWTSNQNKRGTYAWLSVPHIEAHIYAQTRSMSEVHLVRPVRAF